MNLKHCEEQFRKSSYDIDKSFHPTFCSSVKCSTMNCRHKSRREEVEEMRKGERIFISSEKAKAKKKPEPIKKQ